MQVFGKKQRVATSLLTRRKETFGGIIRELIALKVTGRAILAPIQRSREISSGLAILRKLLRR